MAKSKDLDDPFRRGEAVLTTRPLPGIDEGTRGKVRMVNGLSDFNGGEPWLRYWVRFPGVGMIGHVDHDDLARPDQLEQWRTREAERQRQAEAADVTAEPTAGDSDGASGAGDGPESLIPAHLLERSKAAKARLLGG